MVSETEKGKGKGSYPIGTENRRRGDALRTKRIPQKRRNGRIARSRRERKQGDKRN